MAGLKSQINLFTKIQYGMVVALITMTGLFYLGGYRPAVARLRELALNITDSRHELAANTAQAQDLPAVAADINRLRTQLADYKRLPKNLELGEFVTEITELSRQTNLQKLEYSLDGGPRSGEQYTEQAMTLKFEGDFRNVFAFLEKAEDMQRLTRVSSITLHDVDLLSGSIEVEMSMNLYFSEG
jgi:Tfp pilus assembly protein PilO